MPKGGDRKKKGPRATHATVHHKQGKHALVGSDERLVSFKGEAFRLRMQGWSMPEIAEEISRKFELEIIPPRQTVDSWIRQTRQASWEDAKAQAEEERDMSILRYNAMIRKLMPVAMGEKAIEYTEYFEGVPMTVVKIADVKDQIAAMGEIRKCTEAICKVLGIGRDQLQEAAAFAGEAAFEFVRRVMERAFAQPGQVVPEEKKATVLEITSGDPSIDSLSGM